MIDECYSSPIGWAMRFLVRCGGKIINVDPHETRIAGHTTTGCTAPPFFALKTTENNSNSPHFPAKGIFLILSTYHVKLLGYRGNVFYNRSMKQSDSPGAGQNASRFLAAVVESSDDAIITKDLNGIITSWNKAAENIFGYTAQEIIGKPVVLLIPADRENEEPNILRRLRSGEKIDHYETVRRRKDGTLLDISLTVSPVRDEQGVVIGASKVARDITSRKRYEAELTRAREELARTNAELEERVVERTASLERAIRQMEEFSYSVSHDLRSPIRAMKGFATAALEDHGEQLPREVRDYLERIIRSGARMERLIHDVLIYSRLARAEIAMQPVALDHLIPEIVHHYPEMQPPRAEISIRQPLLPVLGHESSLTQALSNLLSNGVKFVPPGVIPKLKVWTEARNGDVRLWIEDNGIGIKPDYQNRLFLMFERIHQNPQYEGTGIGLAIVRKTIEKMGGEVGVKSDGQNGSSFWIQLPASPVPP
jgi:PAS domain S-box-containing protein